MAAASGRVMVPNSKFFPHEEPHEVPAALASQKSDMSTLTSINSLVETPSDGGSSSCRADSSEVIVRNDINFSSQIRSHYCTAHKADDLHLLACFFELAQLADVEGDAVKLLLRVLRFLHLCDYAVEDICSILSHASAYFIDAYSVCGKQMDANEVGNVLATLVFIAHCYVQDETCPLHVWHRHLFRVYCPLKTLNAAVIRLLEIRRYRLRVEPTDLNRRFACLLQAAQHCGIQAFDVRTGSCEQEEEQARRTDIID